MTTEPGHSLPETELNITSEAATSVRRKLAARWSLESAEQPRDLWPLGPKIAPLKELTEALDDPDYDPDDPKSVEEWRNKRRRVSIDQKLIHDMSSEMTAEIDRETIRKVLEAQHDNKR